MEKSFVKWVQLKEAQINEANLASVVQGIRNTIANMRSDPYSWIGSLSHFLPMVQGNPEAYQIVNNIIHTGSAFLNAIRNKNLINHDQRSGGGASGVIKAQVPLDPNQPAGAEYQQLYTQTTQKMMQLLSGLEKLAAVPSI